MDIGDHLVLKAELNLNDPGQSLGVFLLLFSFYTEQHVVRAISLLPEYLWFINVDFVSSFSRL